MCRRVVGLWSTDVGCDGSESVSTGNMGFDLKVWVIREIVSIERLTRSESDGSKQLLCGFQVPGPAIDGGLTYWPMSPWGPKSPRGALFHQFHYFRCF